MNNYITKSIFTSISVILFSIFLIWFLQGNILDKDIVRRENKKLQSINKNYFNKLEAYTHEKFKLITFLVNSSYPEITLDFEMVSQFSKIVEKLNKNKNLSVFLFKKNRGILGENDKKKYENVINQLLLNKDIIQQKYIITPSDFFYISPYISQSSNVVIGYVIGRMSIEDLYNYYKAQYIVASSNLDKIKSHINILNVDRPLITSSLKDGLKININQSMNHSTFLNLSKNEVILYGFILLLLILTVSVFLHYALKKPLNKILELISELARGHEVEKSTLTLPTDKYFKQIGESLLKMHSKRSVLEKARHERTLAKKKTELFEHYVHNFKSPVAALESVYYQHRKSLNEDHRVLFSQAISRIKDILNIMSKSVHSDLLEPSNQKETIIVDSLIESIIASKRLEYNHIEDLDIEYSRYDSSYGLFTLAEKTQLKDIISNIVNNSVESIEKNGMVSVFCKNSKSHLVITINDNGKGMSQETIEKIFNKGFSTKNGENRGQGLYHAKTVIEKLNGSIEVSSQEGKGTSTEILLRLSTPPSWFVPEIVLSEYSRVVILDDDKSIHQIWNDRLSKAKYSGEVEHFYISDKIVEKYQDYQNIENCLFLVDYELLNSSYNGVQVIEKLNIHHNSILVTSRYDSKDILNKCETDNINLLPKSLASFAPIRVNLTLSSDKLNVLLDDDELVRFDWSTHSGSDGSFLHSYSCTDDLLRDLPDIPTDTRFFIDSNLGNSKKGEEVAHDLYYKYGHKEIYLVTGYPKSKFKPMPWIKDIITNKKYPKNIIRGEI